MPDTTYAVVVADPATSLCDEAVRLDASMIVVGNKRVQGAARVLGSIAGDVAGACTATDAEGDTAESLDADGG